MGVEGLGWSTIDSMTRTGTESGSVSEVPTVNARRLGAVRRVRRWVATVPLACVLLTGCDGPAQYTPVAVQLLLRASGTAEMSWRVPGQRDAAAMAEYARVFATALGLPQPVVQPDGRARFTGLSTSRVDLNLADLVAAAGELGLGEEVFVSVCTPQRDGYARGNGVEIVQYGSCATYESNTSDDGAASSATIVFERRWHPAVPLAIGVFVSFVVGLASWIGRLRWRGRRGVSMLSWVCAAALLVCIFLAWRAVDVIEDDPYWETGQSFEQDIDTGLWWTAVGGVVAALALGSLYATRAHRSQTR